jgi:methylated-DNA-protein-cysteine methyltransferase related protein
MKKAHYWEDVYALTKLIPKGRVTTYGAMATYLNLGSPRMVGWALNNVVKGDDVPAQRVVNRLGELSGRLHFDTPSHMQALLEAENIVVIENKVRDFDTLFWNPFSLDADF